MRNNISVEINKSNRIQYFLVGSALFFTTNANIFSLEQVYFWFFTIVLFFFAFNKFHFRLSKNLIVTSFILFTLTIAYYFQFGRFTPAFLISRLLLVLYSFIVIQITKENFFEFLEDIIYKLAYISLPLFLIQLISFDFVFAFFRFLNNFIPIVADPRKANFLVWGLQIDAPFRNSGFMWEPGAFAAILLIAVMINLIINKFAINKRLVVLIIALLSTLSTTGYIGLILIIFFYIWNKKLEYSFFYYPFLILIFVLLMDLPFMREKVLGEYYNIDNRIVTTFANRHDTFVSLGRFASFVVDFEDYLKYPIIGVGGNDEMRLTSNYLVINKTSGLGGFLVTYGSVGILFLVLSLKRTFDSLSNIYKYRGSFIFVLVILVLSFSNSVLTSPLFISLMFFSYVKLPKNIPRVSLRKSFHQIKKS